MATGRTSTGPKKLLKLASLSAHEPSRSGGTGVSLICILPRPSARLGRHNDVLPRMSGQTSAAPCMQSARDSSAPPLRRHSGNRHGSEREAQGTTSYGFASERLSVTQSCIQEHHSECLGQPCTQTTKEQRMLTAGPAARRRCRQTLHSRRRARSGGRELSSGSRYDSASQLTASLLPPPAPLHPGGLCGGARLQGRGSSSSSREGVSPVFTAI